MAKKSLAEYKLTASIHTVKIRSNYAPALHNFDERIVKPYEKIDRATGEKVSHCIINPNNYGVNEVYKYSRYEDVMSELMTKANVSDYSYDRIDFRFDSFEDTFLEYYKLNSLLLGLFTMEYRFRNNEPTESIGQITRSKHGISLKNRSMELVYYNKEIESEGKNICKARLELRAKLLKGLPPEAAARTWYKRLDKAERHFAELQKYYNSCLYKHYLKWLAECCPERKGKDMITAFVRENRNSFFTTRQLQEFCSLCGVENPQSRAKNLKQSCGIEFFSRKVIKAYILKLKKHLKEYMGQ